MLEVLNLEVKVLGRYGFGGYTHFNLMLFGGFERWIVWFWRIRALEVTTLEALDGSLVDIFLEVMIV